MTSPKTAHHAGKGSRVIPLFEDLVPHLKAVYTAAEDKSGYVITRYRLSNVNLRTRMMKTIRRAGLEPSAKTFHNLRATRETELAADFPIHVVCSWIGNSIQIASRNYLQVREDDFSRAIGDAHHFAHQKAPETAGNARQSDEQQDEPRLVKTKKRGENLPPTRRQRWAIQDSNL